MDNAWRTELFCFLLFLLLPRGHMLEDENKINTDLPFTKEAESDQKEQPRGIVVNFKDEIADRWRQELKLQKVPKFEVIVCFYVSLQMSMTNGISLTSRKIFGA